MKVANTAAGAATLRRSLRATLAVLAAATNHHRVYLPVDGPKTLLRASVWLVAAFYELRARRHRTDLYWKFRIFIDNADYTKISLTQDDI